MVDDIETFLQTEGKRARKVLVFYVFWIVLTLSFVWFIMLISGDKKSIAIIGMGTGLILIWGLFGGLITLKIREPLRLELGKHPKYPKLKFFLFALLMVCLEEVVSTAMTNTAPLYGFSPYEAYITASPNYFEVILLHSVVVLWPAYIVWAYALDKYDFHPSWVLILYGFTGLLAEGMSFGWGKNILMFAYWGFVYGLMVYLPAYTFTSTENRKRPGTFIYIIMIFLPLLANIPVTIIVILFLIVLGF